MSNAVNKGFGLLFEMGCGKTLTAIAIAGAGLQFCFWMIDSKGLSSFKPAIADAGSRVGFVV